MGLILRTTRDKGEEASPAERTSHLLRPVSAGVAVPLFALFAAGVSVSGAALDAVFTEPEPLGVVLGLVVGKTVGIFAGTYLAARFTRARLNPDLEWADVFSLAVLAGIGFTVALLIGELAFTDPADAEHIKAAVLVGSLTASRPGSAAGQSAGTRSTAASTRRRRATRTPTASPTSTSRPVAGTAVPKPTAEQPIMRLWDPTAREGPAQARGPFSTHSPGGTMNGSVSLLTVAIVIALLVIRTAITELREPGSARTQWAFVTNARAVTTGAVTAVMLGLLGWRSSGYGALAWAVLVGVLVAFLVDRRPPET